jgi:hypothetical protein
MEFHGKWKILWNSTKFHKIFHGILWTFSYIFDVFFHENFPWNMEFHGKFHEFTERFSPGMKTPRKKEIKTRGLY